MNNKLSIIIPSYNEASETMKTIKNILSTCGDKKDIEIIVIDDCSNESYSELQNNKNIRCIRNNENLGISKSRDIGINSTQNNSILTIDAHMTFKKGWDGEIIEKIGNNGSSILCFACQNISDNNIYYAGGFNLFPKHNKELMLSPFLLSKTSLENVISVPVVAGGAYAFSKLWYRYLNGMKGMIGCGVGEAFLSIKSHLAGGDCKLIKNIKIGHSFKRGNYTINKSHQYYNKIYLSQSILPFEFVHYPFMLLPNNKEKENAINLFKQNSKEILKDRIMYEGIFKTPFADYIKKFNLEY